MSDIQNVTLLCKNTYKDYVIERFGSDVEMNQMDEDHFEVTVEVDLNPLLLGWICGLVDGIRVLGPGKAVDRMRDITGELNDVYGRGKTGREHLM